MFVAFLVSYTGTAMAPIAMAFGVLELTGSAADAAFVIAAPTAASIVVILLGGLLGMQLRPRHPMYVASYCVLFFALVPIALAFPLSVFWVALAAFIAGIAGQIFSVFWYTTFQQKVPEHMLSIVLAKDHLGSIALVTLGIVVFGLIYEMLGTNCL